MFSPGEAVSQDNQMNHTIKLKIDLALFDDNKSNKTGKSLMQKLFYKDLQWK